MARVTESLCFWVLSVLVVSLVSLVLSQDGHGFVHYDFRKANLYVDGMASTEDGRLKLTDSSKRSTGHAFYKNPISFRNTSSSFSTEFVFAIVPEHNYSYGQGMAFVVSPTIDLRYAASGPYLGIFNKTTDNKTENHILAVEFDTNPNGEALDTNHNSVGININSIVSAKSEIAGYYDGIANMNVTLILGNKQRIHVWVEYDAEQLNVTLAPFKTTKPGSPLLSLPIDLSKIFKEHMYFGFSGSTGLIRSHQYILGWALAIGGKSQSLDISKVLDLSQPPTSSPGLTIGQVITISIISVLVLLMIPSGIMYLYFKKKYAEVFQQWEQQYSPQRFSFRTLYKATNGFKGDRVIGVGGFGKVYKGDLSDGTQVAVKRVSHGSQQGLQEYISEIATMARLGHMNLVQLRGYCRRKGEVILVYEHMPNGNFAEYLLKGDSLSWLQRLHIIKGIASALCYLHEGWGQVVLHRDIKASNVLLDANLNAKLGDFGLAKFHDRGMPLEATRVVGTVGYMAPELMTIGVASTCSDVYAFGAFMLEVVCGKKPVDPNRPHEQKILVDWVSSCRSRGALLETIDCELVGDYVSIEMEIVLKLGLLCTQYNPEDRPSMSQVVNFLEGSERLPEMPPDSPGFGPAISIFKDLQKISLFLFFCGFI